MKNKIFYFAFIPFLILSCNSNNGNNGNTDPIDNNDYYIKEDVKISFLCMANQKYLDKLQSMIDEFEQMEPHVKVNLYNPLGSGNYTMLEKLIVSGFFKENYPDISQCYPDNVVKYIAKGYAINLDDYLNNDEYGIFTEGNDYITSFMDEGKGYALPGTYSLPFCKSTELMYYNADALIGLDLHQQDATINNGNPLDEDYLDNLTWDELFDKLCPAIKGYNDAQDDNHKIMSVDESSSIFTYDSDENFFITLANQYGYGYTSVNELGEGSIDFDNDGMRTLVKKLKVAKDNKYLQTRGSYLDYVSELFLNRKALFTVSSTAGLSYNYNENDPFKIGVARIPRADGGSYSAINQGPSVCILDHKDENRSLASYLLWKHITSKENSSDWALFTGYMGIRNSSYQTEEYQKALDVTGVTDLKQIATSDNLKKIAEVRSDTFNTPVFRGSGNTRTIVGRLLKECLLSSGADEDINQLFENALIDAESYLPKN